MANNVGISLDEAVRVLGVIREQKSTMKGKLSNISSSVSNLKSSWKSDAADNLQGIAANMQDRFNELEKDVDGFATLLEQIIQNWDKTETSTKTVMDKVMNAFK
ncbi:hypothetical protein [Aristaeella hokkaidonensis]|uniref:Uncharacterized protein n=1 Tax=Aristaeella hokkaidonensis TaxID=3046382 RepID=A0AC61MVP2_9FIRM|nr:hypothetical protein [Aristaeella hokkaidonensis]QUC66377.1 hypothetical protein JYE49_10970 [Aristaeella hokkaidonensis]SNT94212.1 Uncharacterized conserved protein YukE [Aristaeella hokkaidonensis]